MAATADGPVGPRAAGLAWIHAGLFGGIGLACYLSPETLFGDAAWLPLPRLAVLLFAAALVSAAVVLVGSAWSGSGRQTRLALLAALALDVQVPVLMFSQPASLEHLQSGLGFPWFLVPLTFLVMVGLTVPCVLSPRRIPAPREAASP
jgi:hypothetical protein